MNSLKELLRTIDPSKLEEMMVANEEILEITGTKSTNESVSRLFIWNFEKEDIKCLIEYFERIDGFEINNRFLRDMKSELIRRGKEISRTGVYPVECILYATKVINNRLVSDDSLKEVLAEVVGYFIQGNEVSGEKVISHICKNWSWTQQQKIAVLASKEFTNKEMLSLIYNEFSDVRELKFECFKTLLESKNEEAIDMVLDIVCKLDSDFESDRKIGKLFQARFEGAFLGKGIDKARDVIQNRPNISYFGKRVIDHVIGNDIMPKGRSFAMNELIKLMKDFKRNKKIIKDVLLNGSKNEIFNALRCFGYASDRDEAANMLFKWYENKGNKGNDYLELGLTSIALGLLNDKRAVSMCKKHGITPDIKPFEWAAGILLGDNTKCRLLADELLKETISQSNDSMKAIRPCITRSKQLVKEIESSFCKLIIGANEEDFCKYLRNIKNFIESNENLKIRNEVFRMMGMKGKDDYLYGRVIQSTRIQGNVMGVLQDVVNEDNIKIYEKLLFNISSNNDFEMKIRSRASDILKNNIDVGVVDN